MRLVQLDALRAVAVLLVIGHHLAPVLGGPSDSSLGVVEAWQRCGWVGVDLFFVLSGFLVSGLLFREQQLHGEVRLGRFLVRRGLKIYPPFYCFLAVVVAYRLAKGAGVTAGEVLSEAFFVQNYGAQVWSHTWSLAVEEHFYLLLGPLLLLLRGGRGGPPFRALVPLFGAVAAACLAGRLVTAAALPFTPKTHLFPTHLRLDSLLFGVVLSYYWHFEPRRLAFVARARLAVLPGCLLLVAPSFFLELGHPFMHTLGFTCLYVGFGGALLAALSGPLPAGVARRPLRALAAVGAHSYSIYLWHYPVLSTGLPLARRLLGPLPYAAEVALGVAGSLAVGVGMSRLIEAPVVRLRDRLFASRSAPAGGGPAPQAEAPAPAPGGQRELAAAA
jgi:peptidoglycan/LPS O-acetylase OafA/YrhL